MKRCETSHPTLIPIEYIFYDKTLSLCGTILLDDNFIKLPCLYTGECVEVVIILSHKCKRDL